MGSGSKNQWYFMLTEITQLQGMFKSLVGNGYQELGNFLYKETGLILGMEGKHYKEIVKYKLMIKHRVSRLKLSKVMGMIISKEMTAVWGNTTSLRA
eukprot:693474-Prorocentrum_lima.AAC.1